MVVILILGMFILKIDIYLTRQLMQIDILLKEPARYRDALLGLLKMVEVKDLTGKLADEVKLIYQLIDLIEIRIRAGNSG